MTKSWPTKHIQTPTEPQHVGEQQESLNQLYECHVVRKARRIAGDAVTFLLRIMSIFPPAGAFELRRSEP